MTMFWVSTAEWNSLRAQLNRIEQNQTRSMTRNDQQWSTEMAEFKDIATKVAAQKTVIDSTAVIIAGMKAQLEALKNAPSGPTSDDIQKVLDDLDANTNELVSAVPANTAASSEPAPPVATAVSNASATVGS